MVLVPTLELGVQTALLVYKLWGGSINPGVPGLAGNMFAYTGPRGMKASHLEIWLISDLFWRSAWVPPP